MQTFLALELYQWLDIAGVFSRLKAKIGRYQLSVIAVIALLLFILLIIWTFYQLAVSTMDKSRLIRTELFDRDLRELTGHFDSDERYVLEKNLAAFLSEERLLSPLLLPRQYYVALPSGNSKFTPRLPPRNCFVDLIKQETKTTTQKFPEKFCAYFADNKSVGSYLFFSIAFVDSEIHPLRSGDISFTADSVKIIVENEGIKGTWFLVLQRPINVTNTDRYQLTAYKEKNDGVRELDKKFEGWAYVQKQANNSNVINLLARLDFKEFYDITNDDTWPPSNWVRTRIQLSRNDATSQSNIESIEYSDIGFGNLSIPSLSKSIYSAYANLNVKVGKDSWPVEPMSQVKHTFKDSNNFIRFVDGDLLLRQDPIVRSQLLQDTNLSFEIKHPGAVIEKSIWKTAIYIIALLISFILLTIFILSKLLIPIWKLSRDSRQLVTQSTDRTDLPYSDRNDEIGALSRGFNELLRETRDQSKREQDDRERRAEVVRRSQFETVRNREVNLQIIGHEIRSPLQALRSLHNESSESWRYIERITNAVTQLFGADSPETAFTLREINLEHLELGTFLSAVAKNSPLANISNVSFTGPQTGVFVNVDPTALEDALTNILINGNRYRSHNSALTITLSCDANNANIDIFNDGPKIPEDKLQQIFDLYFTTESVSANQLHGIGLYVAKSYISRMDGTISAHNEVAGVIFRITLPISL